MTSPLTQTLGFDSQWFDLPGLRLHAAVAGPANDPLVLLLHGRRLKSAAEIGKRA